MSYRQGVPTLPPPKGASEKASVKFVGSDRTETKLTKSWPLPIEEHPQRPSSLLETYSNDKTELTYPSTAPSYVNPKPSEGGTLLRWIVLHVTQRLNPYLRGPLKAIPPTIGLFSAGYDHELHDAVLNNNKKDVRRRLSAGSSPEQWCGPLGVTELQWAATVNAIDVIPVLVRAGSNLMSGNTLGHSPLQCATVYGNAEAVCVLTDCKADVNQKMMAPWFMRFLGMRYADGPAIMSAVSLFESLDCTRALLICGADPRIKNAAGLDSFDVCSKGTVTGKRIRRVLARWAAKHPGELDTTSRVTSRDDERPVEIVEAVE